LLHNEAIEKDKVIQWKWYYSFEETGTFNNQHQQKQKELATPTLLTVLHRSEFFFRRQACSSTMSYVTDVCADRSMDRPN
jgi:hypothetical protein